MIDVVGKATEVGGYMRSYLLLVTIFIGFISACASTSVDKLPIRSPQEFLSNVKVVVDAGDLKNVEFVSRWLRIEYRRGLRDPVYDEGGQSIVGYRVDMVRNASSKEYRREGNFHYRIYQPDGVDFYRGSISLPVDTGVICIASSDLVGVFGDVARHPIGHGAGWGYVYERRELDMMVSFGIYGNGCVSRVGISKNRTGR
ncbi:hypothetical protein G3N57_04780 [Paraburkholderia sp. Se-20369]|nr:hypothetical protein [Paraburkholderia sp. Se-20369]